MANNKYVRNTLLKSINLGLYHFILSEYTVGIGRIGRSNCQQNVKAQTYFSFTIFRLNPTVERQLNTQPLTPCREDLKDALLYYFQSPIHLHRMALKETENFTLGCENWSWMHVAHILGQLHSPVLAVLYTLG